MKLYISGPISGKENGNREEFARVSQIMRLAGHDVLNPHDVPPSLTSLRRAGGVWTPTVAGQTYTPGERQWEDCMWDDVAALAQFRPEGVVMLEGYASSRGARAELMLLKALGCTEFYMSGGRFVTHGPPDVDYDEYGRPYRSYEWWGRNGMHMVSSYGSSWGRIDTPAGSLAPMEYQDGAWPRRVAAAQDAGEWIPPGP